MLRKPGKLRYDIPKAYWLIALLNTLAKLLSSIVAEGLSFLTEKHQLIPPMHFGGWPGRTTTDSLHLLVDTIKAVWRRRQVVSVLFLDIEGAFPNAVTPRLLHNLHKSWVPEVYVSFISNMLMGRHTQLRFDDHVSSWIGLDNSIGQGDPLSMLLYLYFNSDVLEVLRGRNEMGLGYVNDMALIAVTKDFMQAHQCLKQMMTRTGITHHNGEHSTFQNAHNLLH